jgi:hypothetical protein
LLVLFAPIVILVITLGFLRIAEGLVVGELSPLEILELYVTELVLFSVVAYGLYRASMTAVEGRVDDRRDDRGGDPEDGEQARAHHRPLTGARTADPDRSGDDPRATSCGIGPPGGSRQPRSPLRGGFHRADSGSHPIAAVNVGECRFAVAIPGLLVFTVPRLIDGFPGCIDRTAVLAP